MYPNHVLWKTWVSMPKKTVSHQRNSSEPFEIQTLCIFHQVRLLDKFIVHARTRHRQQLRLPLRDFQTLPQKVGTENCCLTWSTKNVCKNVSSRPIDLFCRFCWNDSARSPLLATTSQMFSECLSSHTLCSCLETLSTTNSLCNFWHSKLEHVSTYALCHWDDIFTQKGNCKSPKNLCKSPESPSPLSSNRSIVWNFYLSWSNQTIL